MPKGVIKYFSEDRGYGFIKSEEEESLFVHYTEIVGEGYRTLKEGQEVLFDIRKSSSGLEAVNVHKL